MTNDTRTPAQRAAYERTMGDARTVAQQQRDGIVSHPADARTDRAVEGAPHDLSTPLVSYVDVDNGVGYTIHDTTDCTDLILSTWPTGGGPAAYRRLSTMAAAYAAIPDAAELSYRMRGFAG